MADGKEDIRDAVMEVVEAMYPEIDHNASQSSFTLLLDAQDGRIYVRCGFVLPPSYPGELSVTIIGGLGSKALEQRLSDSVREFIDGRVGGEEDEMLLLDVIAVLRGEEDECGVIEEIYDEVSNAGAQEQEDELSLFEPVRPPQPDIEWTHSEPLVSKGSVFVASGALISSPEQVPALVQFHGSKVRMDGERRTAGVK